MDNHDYVNVTLIIKGDMIMTTYSCIFLTNLLMKKKRIYVALVYFIG